MCLWTTQEKPVRADAPIKAYKVLEFIEEEYFSPVQFCNYTPFIENNILVKEKVPRIEYEGEFYIIGRGRVNEGLHLFTELGSAELVASRSSKRVVFECEIPEGAYYFLNLDRTEICTNKFRFIKEV